MSDIAPLRIGGRRLRAIEGAAALGLAMVAPSACTVPTPAPALHVVPPAMAAPPASSSEPAAATPATGPRAVAGGYALAPLEPRPQRAEMAGTAALVWEVTPAPANEDGPRERDAIRTRLVVDKGGAAVVVAERGEAVFSSRASLWRLRAEELVVDVEDCTASAPRTVQERRQHIVFESLERKPRRIAPMEGHVLAGEWARLDLESMAGSFVQVAVDRYASSCLGMAPRGSGYRLVLDLDAGAERALTTPPGVRPGQVARVREAMAAGCGSGRQELVEGGVGFHYDAAGDLVAEYDFAEYVAPVCYAGTLHVFAGSFVLPPELAPHARLPRWLREWLARHPSRGISVIPVGREAEARQEMLSLPAVSPALPRDSGGGG